MDGDVGDFDREDLNSDSIHPQNILIHENLGTGNRPHGLMRPRHLNGITIILVKKFRHGILNQDTCLKNSHFTPAVCVSRGDENFFFIIVLHGILLFYCV